MRRRFSVRVRQIGMTAAILIVLLAAIYGGFLVSAFDAEKPIAGRTLIVLEAIIVLLAVPMIAFAVAAHRWTTDQDRLYGLLGSGFTSATVLTTLGVHGILLLHACWTSDWGQLGSNFVWPSWPYGFDILAWDFLFPLSAACFAKLFARSHPVVGGLFTISSMLAFLGLLGIPFNDMGVRNIGIIGYAVVFPFAVAGAGKVFYLTQPRRSDLA